MLSKDSADGLGKVFRFVTPALILLLGWMLQTFYVSMDRRFERWDTRMDSFIEQNHLLDRRVDKVEYKVFGLGNGGNITTQGG